MTTGRINQITFVRQVYPVTTHRHALDYHNYTSQATRPRYIVATPRTSFTVNATNCKSNTFTENNMPGCTKLLRGNNHKSDMEDRIATCNCRAQPMPRRTRCFRKPLRTSPQVTTTTFKDTTYNEGLSSRVAPLT